MIDSKPAYEPADYTPYFFKADDRKQLENELRASGISGAPWQRFIAALEHAIGMYKAGIRSDLETSPSSARKALKAALKTLEKLCGQLDRLETASGKTSLLAVDVDLEALRYNQLELLRSQFTDAVSSIPVPQSRSCDITQLFLIKNVAEAIQDELLIAPTSTRGGFYEGVLEIVMTAATGTKPKSLHALTCRGITFLEKRTPKKSAGF